ncbi:MAG: hypothetical protein ACO3QB_13670 [bacterium]|jgi:hypothetical protein
MNEYPRIVRAYLREDFQMKVVFKDGLAGVVDLRKLVPLKFLNRLQSSGDLMLPMIDEVAGTVCWKDGTDLSPVRAHELLQKSLNEKALVDSNTH